MKDKFLIFLLFAFFITLFFGARVYAVSYTPEATPTGQKVLDKGVKEIREAVREKVRGMLDEAKKGQKKAFVGKIFEITNASLVLKTREGEKQAEVATDAAIIGKNKKQIKFKDLEIGAFTIAMGYLDKNNILQTKRLVIIDEPPPLERQIVIGQVTDISAKSKLITVRNKGKNETYTLAIDEGTKIVKKVGGKTKLFKFSQMEIGNKIVSVGRVEKKGVQTITAKIIQILTGTSPSPAPTKQE